MKAKKKWAQRPNATIIIWRSLPTSLYGLISTHSHPHSMWISQKCSTGMWRYVRHNFLPMGPRPEPQILRGNIEQWGKFAQKMFEIFFKTYLKKIKEMAHTILQVSVYFVLNSWSLLFEIVGMIGPCAKIGKVFFRCVSLSFDLYLSKFWIVFFMKFLLYWNALE